MSLPTRQPTYDVVWLRTFWLMSGAALVLGAAIALFVGAAGPYSALVTAAVALSAFGVWLLFLRRHLRHGREARAIILAGIGQYVVMVALMPVLPQLAGILLPSLVLPVFLIIPYLHGRALTRFIILVWAFSVAYATAAYLYTVSGHDGLMYAAEEGHEVVEEGEGSAALTELADTVMNHIAAMEAEQLMTLVGWVLILSSMLVLLRRYAHANDEARTLVHDSLTGLPNRALFMDRLTQALQNGQRRARLSAVVFLDIDAFKAFNDTHGHGYGDDILRRVGERIASSTRAGDTTARVGGDEFAVLLPDLEKAGEAEAVAERLRQSLADPIRMKEGLVPVRVSMGLAVSDVGGEAADQLLKNADDAMYRSKHRGLGDLVVYETAMSEASERRLAVKRSFRGIVERGELRLQFQPLVKVHVMNDGETGAHPEGEHGSHQHGDDHAHTRSSLVPAGSIVGVEALVRWEDPERGWQLPDLFVGLAEETGDIVPIGRWVLQEAIRHVMEWRRTTPASNLFVAVNLSARQLTGTQLREPAFDREVRAVLDSSGLDPRALVLEISEHMQVLDEPGVEDVLERLRSLGVVLALDDFGTGYSSLGSLKHLRVEMVKIDRSLLADAVGSREDSAVLRAAAEVGVALGAEVVIEGIETVEQLDLVLDMPSELGQGYFFGRPMDPDAMRDMLLADANRWENLIRRRVLGDTPGTPEPMPPTGHGLGPTQLQLPTA